MTRVWKRSGVELPPKDETVLVYHEYAEEPVWLGYHDGQEWRYADGGSCRPLFWSALPTPPGMEDHSSLADLLRLAADSENQTMRTSADVMPDQVTSVEIPIDDRGEPMRAERYYKLDYLGKCFYGEDGELWFQKCTLAGSPVPGERPVWVHSLRQRVTPIRRELYSESRS